MEARRCGTMSEFVEDALIERIARSEWAELREEGINYVE